MNVKVIENLSLLTPLAFRHLSTDIAENSLCPKDVKLHPIPWGGGGERGTPYNGLYREAHPKGVPFSGFRCILMKG